LWLFEACSCKPAPRDPPSSIAQLQHFPCLYGALSSQCPYDVIPVPRHWDLISLYNGSAPMMSFQCLFLCHPSS
ncbi:MAG: hypothetical protein ACR5K5_02610, partial [Wolbachia sp.]